MLLTSRIFAPGSATLRAGLLFSAMGALFPVITQCGGAPGDGDRGGLGGQGGDAAATGGALSTGGSVADDDGEGGGGGEPTPAPDPILVLVAAGRSVSLINVAGGELDVVSTAEIPAAGLLGGHQIFSIIKQPGENVVFVGSSNDCSNDTDWCWGNGRIDRFAFTATSVTYDGLAYEMNNAAFLADGISCAEGTDVDGYIGQEGQCAPGGLAFSANGSRFYVDDDELDGVEIFEVESNGDLTFLAEGGSTTVNGLVANPQGTYVYNGGRVISIAGDVVTDGNQSLAGGNSTEVLPGTPLRLATTFSVDTLAVLNLTDPAVPTVIDSLAFASNQVRYQAHNSDASRFVVVGQNSVRSVSFDGTDLLLEDEQIAGGISARQNRGVTLAGEDSEWAVVAFFRGGNGDPVKPGGFTLYSVDTATGALALRDLLEVAGPARAVISVTP